MIGPEFPLTPTPFVRFDAQGAITETGQMSAYAVWRMSNAGQNVIVGTGSPGAHYVCLKRNKVKLKLDNPTRLVGLSLIGVPAGSTLKIEDVQPSGVPARSEHQASGKVDLEFDFPGTYRVEVSSAKHLTAVFEVVA